MAYSPYSELIDKMQKEITTLRQMVLGEEPDVFEKQEQIIAALQGQVTKRDRELSAARRAIRKKDAVINQLQCETSKCCIVAPEPTIMSKDLEIITSLTESIESYRRANIELKFQLDEKPQIVYRNTPDIEMFKKAGIKVVHIEKLKRGKSKEQQAFDRKYKKVRLKILERDGYKCVDCGNDEELHVHHIIHKSDGGTNDPNNLVTLCKWCHAERHKGENVYNIMAKGL